MALEQVSAVPTSGTHCPYHGHALSNGGREGGRVGIDDTSWGEGILVLLGEVEKPVRVIWEQVHAIEIGVGHAELRDQVRVFIDIDGQGHRGDDRKGDKSETEKHHGEGLPVEARPRFFGVRGG